MTKYASTLTSNSSSARGTPREITNDADDSQSAFRSARSRGSAVREGRSHSRNEFVSDAVRSALAAAERARIDAEFATMADDAVYQQEASEIAREFEVASWEALQDGEARE